MPKYESWQAQVELRPEIDRDSHGVPFRTGAKAEVVVIYSPHGTAYEVTVSNDDNGFPQVATLTIRPPAGVSVDHAALRQIPLRTLAEVAAGHLQQYRTARSDGLNTSEATALASSMNPVGSSVSSSGKPDVEQFAKVWNASRSHVETPEGVKPRRLALAIYFGVSPWSIDKYLREARDLGLVAPSKVGRPRKLLAPSPESSDSASNSD